MASYSTQNPNINDTLKKIKHITETYLGKEEHVRESTSTYELINCVDASFSLNKNDSSSAIKTIKINNITQRDANQIRNRIGYAYIAAGLLDTDDNVLDLGSHHGMIGHFLSNFTTGKVVMIEASINEWEKCASIGNTISTTSGLENLFRNCFYFNGAITNETKVAEFWTSRSKTVSNSLSKQLTKDPESTPLRVAAYDFRTIFELFSPKVLKINIEGEDSKIVDIINAEHKIARSLRSIMFEIDPDRPNIRLLEDCTKNFKSILAIRRATKKTIFPYEFKTINNPNKDLTDFKGDHIIVSNEDIKILAGRMERTVSLYSSRWNL